MLSVTDLCVSRGGRKLYHNFTLAFETEKTTVILAASGAGKTTLLDCLSGLLKPDSGTVCVPDRISYLFQEPRLFPWYSLEKNIFLPVAGVLPPEKAAERTSFFLRQTGLSGRAAAVPARCSGGERQRAALARAFAYPSPVLLMDEAFQSQDPVLKLKLMELTEQLLDTERRTVVMVTHDVREAVSLADRIIVLGKSPLEILCDISLSERKEPVTRRYIAPDQTALHTEELVLDMLYSAGEAPQQV